MHLLTFIAENFNQDTKMKLKCHRFSERQSQQKTPSTQSTASILNPITDSDWYVTSLTYYRPKTPPLAPSNMKLKRDSLIEIHS